MDESITKYHPINSNIVKLGLKSKWKEKQKEEEEEEKCIGGRRIVKRAIKLSSLG